MRFLRRQVDPTSPSTPLHELTRLADDAVALAEQIKQTVAELRKQDTRGETDDAAERQNAGGRER